jgi:alcohol dehydrogenase class IV
VPDLVRDASRVHHVGPGRVDELAAALLPEASGDLLVAVGGGRVIDVTKALAAARPPTRVAAIPTTLSGAEMTAVHRHAVGVPAETARVRPAIVINDPALCASQPPRALAQSAGNALGHAFEGPLTMLGNPVALLAAVQGVRLIGDALQSHGDPVDEDRDLLALGALLAGYVIGSTGYGLHHVLSQTLVRVAGIGHGAANAVMLPWSLGALELREQQALAAFRDALGFEPRELAERVRELAGVARLRDAGVSRADLKRCASEASQRPELALTPPAAGIDEIRVLYESAY